MNYFNKLKTFLTIFPYSPVGLNLAIKSLWIESIHKSTFRYKALYRISNLYLKFCKLLGLSSWRIKSKIFEYETTVKDKAIGDFIYQKNAFHLFNTGVEKDIRIINNKIEFHDFCLRNELPVPKKIGEIIHGKIDLDLDCPPWETERDFMIKPIFGAKSKGVLDFKKQDGKNKYLILDEGRELDPVCMKDYLNAFLDKKISYIIQERLKPTEEILQLGINNVPIIRILTVLNGGIVELINPVLIINPDRNYLNPSLKRKSFYAVNNETGKIFDELVFNNSSKGQIALNDTLLLDWATLKSKVLMAHGQIETVRIIGWDIAWSSKGYKFLEANKSPWLEIHQKDPFDSFRFQKLVLSWI
ncbi:MAG: hypothetical protein ACJASR_001023 [Psychroserpens sp.]|jgi:hypothetical protein